MTYKIGKRKAGARRRARLFSLLLCASLGLSYLPAAALADGEQLHVHAQAEADTYESAEETAPVTVAEESTPTPTPEAVVSLDGAGSETAGEPAPLSENAEEGESEPTTEDEGAALTEATAAASVTTAEGTTTYYSSAADALAAVSTTGSTVKLLGEADLGSSTTLPVGTYTIDLNGFTMSGADAIVFDGGTLYVKDSSEAQSGKIDKLELKMGSLNLCGGTYNEICAVRIAACLASGYAFQSAEEGGAMIEYSALTENTLSNIKVVKCTHTWNTTGECKYCGEECEHGEWHEGECTTCGFVCVHEGDEDGVCEKCEQQVCDSHSWSGGQCSNCNYECPHATVDDTGVCANCKMQLPIELEVRGVRQSWCTDIDDLTAAIEQVEGKFNAATIRLHADLTGGAVFSTADRTYTLDLNGHSMGKIIVQSDGSVVVTAGTLTAVENSGALTLGAGVVVTGEIKNTAGKLTAVLAENTALAQKDGSGEYAKIVSADVTSLSDVKVIAHEHTYDNETHACVCGVVCSHKNTGSGVCGTCGKTFQVGLRVGSDPAQWFDSLTDALAAVVTGRTNVITLYADEALADSITLSAATELELNGHTLTLAAPAATESEREGGLGPAELSDPEDDDETETDAETDAETNTDRYDHKALCIAGSVAVKNSKTTGGINGLIVVEEGGSLTLNSGVALNLNCDAHGETVADNTAAGETLCPSIYVEAGGALTLNADVTLGHGLVCTDTDKTLASFLATGVAYSVGDETDELTDKTYYLTESTLKTVAVNCDEEHDYSDDGFCKQCGQPQPAEAVDGAYQIANVGNLYWFAAQVNAGNKSYNAVLTKDITVNAGVVSNGALQSGSFRAWTPIGESSATAYTGCFDGNGKTISGLYLNASGSSYVGLFGHVGSGTVENVTVSNSYFSGVRFAAAIAGEVTGGSVKNCKNAGCLVTAASECAGGIVGGNWGTVTGCENSGSVLGGSLTTTTSGTTITSYCEAVGGIVGFNNGSVKTCRNTTEVSGGSVSKYLGGIAGYDTSLGDIEGCTNSGAVNGGETVQFVGGILGYGEANGAVGVRLCANSGTVSGKMYVGGVVGKNQTMLANCYNTGTVSGERNVGGVAGSCNTSQGKIDGCYNCGLVQAIGTASNNIALGSLVGEASNCGGVTNCCSQSGTYATLSGNKTDTAVGNGDSAREGVTVLSAGDFASGKACWLLNKQSTDGVWKQTLGTDTYPGFTGQTVYGEADVYSNQPIYSLSIQWGRMIFTYYDTATDDHAVGWTTTGNAITVTNNGSQAVTPTVSYRSGADYSNITGAVSGESSELAAGDSATFSLSLSGAPKASLSETPVGTITVQIA